MYFNQINTKETQTMNSVDKPALSGKEVVPAVEGFAHKTVNIAGRRSARDSLQHKTVQSNTPADERWRTSPRKHSVHISVHY